MCIDKRRKFTCCSHSTEIESPKNFFLWGNYFISQKWLCKIPLEYTNIIFLSAAYLFCNLLISCILKMTLETLHINTTCGKE